jgi:ribosomal protein S18 acetylase RimI-like enzyme
LQKRTEYLWVFASYEFNYKGEPKTKIHKIYILPETQGKGIGKKLLDYIVEKAKENRNTILSLNVNRYNSAYEFYVKIGFEKKGEEDINIGNGYLMEDYIMEKQL